MQNKCLELALSLFVLAGVAFCPTPSIAQGPAGDPNVNMILFPVNRDQNNQQYIISRAGYKINIQGIGIDKNAKQIAVYQDNQNNFWYINKKGQPTEVNPEQMQKVQAQIQAQEMMRQQGGSNPQNVTVNNYGNTGSGSSSGSSGSSALGTGLAAMGGAMGGAAIGAAMTGAYNQPYYGVPYGHPIYREPNTGNYYYHGANNNNVYVKPTQNTAAMFNQYDKQGAWKDRDQWQNNPNWNRQNHLDNPNMNGVADRHADGDGGRKFGGRLHGGDGAAASGVQDRGFRGRESGAGRRGGGRFR